MASQTLSLGGSRGGREEAGGGGHSLSYRVAGLGVTLTSPQEGPLLAPEAGSREFVAAAGPDDLHLTVDWADELAQPSGRLLFDSGGVWKLFRQREGYAFSFCSPALGAAPYKLATVSHEFTRGRILLARRHFDSRVPLQPLEYPLDEVLMIHRLGRGAGVELHACGVADAQGRGLLFLGHSGAGKSTTARLWKSAPGAKVLSDDRIILRRDFPRDLRREPEGLRIHGTPWHGEAGVAAAASAPLRQVYFLEHAPRNEFVPLSGSRATAEMLARSFVAYHSAAALEFTLHLLADVVEQVPCHVFRFLPDATSVRAIEDHGRED
ncbi:MAG TPA: hypothetical protein VJX29_11980 [Candidatus Acidoferrales bacterium]|nr:hypothetical protein [Candidatus Acidoferrales bacterium]